MLSRPTQGRQFDDNADLGPHYPSGYHVRSPPSNHKHGIIQSYPNALLNQVVLISLELVLQPICLRFHDLSCSINPFCIKSSFTLSRRDFCKRCHCSLISANVFAGFCLGDSGFQGFCSKVCGAGAYEVQTIEPSAAYTASN